MTETRPFNEVYQELFATFGEGDFQAVIDECLTLRETYPENIAQLYYLAMCGAARLDDIDRACALLGEALDKGEWYSEFLLTQSPSLKPIADNPAYVELIKRSVAMQAEDQVEGGTLVIPADPSKGTLLALHGNTSSATETRELWEPLHGLGLSLLLPDSQQAMMRGAQIWDDYDATLAQVKEVIDEHNPADPLIIAGHSMGAQLAIWLVLAGHVSASHVVVMGAYVPQDTLDGWAELIEASEGRDLHVAILTGGAEDTIPLESLDALCEALNAAGHTCEHRMIPDAGHDDFTLYHDTLMDVVAGWV